MTVVIKVQPSQVDQWMTVFAVRCLEPRKMRMKMYFAVICLPLVMFKFVGVELTYVEIDSHRHDKSGQRKTIADFLHKISCGAKRWRCNIIATIVVHNDTHDKVDASSDTTA